MTRQPDKPSFLGWMDWLMTIPPDWRPLNIEGAWRSGAVMVGDAEQAVFRVTWWRPRRRRIRPDRWVRRRLKRSVRKDSDPSAGPASPDVECIAWLPGGEDAGKTLWCGYSPAARLLLEIVIGGHINRRKRGIVSKECIPSLRTFPEDSPSRWAVFDSAFEIPPDLRCSGRKLALGDMALRFDARGGRRLVVRQVFPAGLALSRRELPRWLRSRPFEEQRRYRSLGDPEPWTTGSFGRTLEGIRVRGRKRLPFPFGPLRKRLTASAGVRDPRLDRLLIAEYDCPSEPDDALLRGVIGGMNWPAFDKGDPE